MGLRDLNRDPNMKALKRRGFMNHGSALVWFRVNVLVQRTRASV